MYIILTKTSKPWKSEELDIDVETVKKIDVFCSSDEESESTDFLFLPITPEVDDPEESPHLPQRDPTSEMGAQSEDHQTPDEKLKSGKRTKATKKSAKRQKLRWTDSFFCYTKLPISIQILIYKKKLSNFWWR